MTADDTTPARVAEAADRIAARIETHLSTGLGCHCGWKIDTSQRPVDPRRQHRRHVAEVLAAAGGPDDGTAEPYVNEAGDRFWVPLAPGGSDA